MYQYRVQCLHPHILIASLKDPPPEATALRHGWFITGDHHLERKVFIAGRKLHGELAEVTRPQAYSPLPFMHETHILVVSLQLVRSRIREGKSQGYHYVYGLFGDMD